MYFSRKIEYHTTFNTRMIPVRVSYCHIYCVRTLILMNDEICKREIAFANYMLLSIKVNVNLVYDTPPLPARNYRLLGHLRHFYAADLLIN